jgi:phage-related minor tail protein
MFTEQEQQLQSYSKSVTDLQAAKDQLEKKLLQSTQQLQEEMSCHEHQMNELIKSHQVLLL